VTYNTYEDAKCSYAGSSACGGIFHNYNANFLGCFAFNIEVSYHCFAKIEKQMVEFFDYFEEISVYVFSCFL